MVLATQNPIEPEGTYPLPEAQLDRFLFKVQIDYPSQADEVALVRHVTEGKVGDRLDVDAGDARWSSPRPWSSLQADRGLGPRRRRGARLRGAHGARHAHAGRASPPAPARAARSRSCARRAPRRCSRAATIVTPDDVKRIALPALRHRIAPSPELELEGRDTDAILKGLLEKIEARGSRDAAR